MAEDRSIGTSETTAGAAPGAGEKKWSRQEAEHLQEELLKKGESLLNEQKGTVAEVLNGIANALDKSAPHFEEEGQPNTARYTRQAAENLHGLARDLNERDMESLGRQVTDLARRQPGLIAGGAVALGFLASRFFRSSAEHSEQEYPGDTEFREREETLIVGTETGFRAGSTTSSPIITEREFKEEEKDLPK
jgi:polyhydroxyalkanoate synthesis regulator phasin